MLRAIGVVGVVLLLAVAYAGGWIVAKTGMGQGVEPASLTALERAFAERMHNVALVGFFTVEGREDDAQRHPERYEITSVVKIDAANWRFDARIIFGNTDVTLPVTVPIVWAGDTPMISITDFTIPPLGSFTVRLIFYDDRYAGSWQHGATGGLMFGTIQKVRSYRN